MGAYLARRLLVMHPEAHADRHDETRADTGDHQQQGRLALERTVPQPLAAVAQGNASQQCRDQHEDADQPENAADHMPGATVGTITGLQRHQEKCQAANQPDAAKGNQQGPEGACRLAH